MKHCNSFIIFITDRLSKLTQSILTARLAAPHLAHAIFENRIIPYHVWYVIVTGNERQTTFKISVLLYPLVYPRLIKTKSYDPKTNGSLDR